jgi:predicted DNA binding protein
MAQEIILKLLENNKNKEYSIEDLCTILGISDWTVRKSISAIQKSKGTENIIKTREIRTEKNAVKLLYSWNIRPVSSILSETKQINWTAVTSDKFLYLITERLDKNNKLLEEFIKKLEAKDGNNKG